MSEVLNHLTGQQIGLLALWVSLGGFCLGVIIYALRRPKPIAQEQHDARELVAYVRGQRTLAQLQKDYE